MTRIGETCSNKQLDFVSNVAECKEAAKKLGMFFEVVVKELGFPKACLGTYEYAATTTVFWNSAETGKAHIDAFSICKLEGNYNQHIPI